MFYLTRQEAVDKIPMDSRINLSFTSIKLVAVMVLLMCTGEYFRLVESRRDNPDNVRNAAITELLDSLLRGYNRHLRPNFGGPPLEVETNILIRSMGPVSEKKMTFSMDCYFRQTWTDTRLRFNATNNITQLRPSIKMLEEIWKPDTFFLNGLSSYLHKITYSNRFLRIQSDGSIYFSQRLTVKSSCLMNLEKYPLDSQMCPLMIGSYGYSDRDVRLVWQPSNDTEPVREHEDITMAQFSLTHISIDTKMSKENHGERSVLYVEFHLQREIGFYLLQIYLPCYLIVIISWVSFWINREATPARVTLGITTLLTTCTIAITGREGIPKVSYSTALDIFLLLCFSFVFAALVEYAGVNYFTKATQKEGPPPETESDEEADLAKPLLMAQSIPGQGIQRAVTTDVNGHTLLGVNDVTSSVPKERCWTMFLHCLKGNAKYRNFKALNKKGSLSVSKIDSLARIIFPFSFTCLNILYWAGFMYYF